MKVPFTLKYVHKRTCGNGKRSNAQRKEILRGERTVLCLPRNASLPIVVYLDQGFTVRHHGRFQQIKKMKFGPWNEWITVTHLIRLLVTSTFPVERQKEREIDSPHHSSWLPCQAWAVSLIASFSSGPLPLHLQPCLYVSSLFSGLMEKTNNLISKNRKLMKTNELSKAWDCLNHS